MIEYKTQTNRSTKFNKTSNINLELKDGVSFGVVTSNYWGNFNDEAEANKYHKKHTERNPLIEIDFEGDSFEMTFEEFKDLLRDGLKGGHYKAK